MDFGLKFKNMASSYHSCNLVFFFFLGPHFVTLFLFIFLVHYVCLYSIFYFFSFPLPPCDFFWGVPFLCDFFLPFTSQSLMMILLFFSPSPLIVTFIMKIKKSTHFLKFNYLEENEIIKMCFTEENQYFLATNVCIDNLKYWTWPHLETKINEPYKT